MPTLSQKAEQYLYTLAGKYPSRRVGNPANQAATRFLSQTIQAMGLKSDSQRFSCFDHYAGEIILSAGNKSYNAHISPHSLGCGLQAELTTASNLDELRNGDFQDKILLMQGELAKQQLTPKGYPFYNIEIHQEIYRLLEMQKPAAIIGATGKNPGLAGASYPFPLFEDGNFNIPSAYIKDIEGAELAGYAGESITLKMDAERIPSWAENISLKLGDQSQARLVFCAHIDSKYGTPGAVDNACGVITLLLLADLLKDEKNIPAIEMVAFNGEDHFSAGGELEYLKQNKDSMDKIKLVTNIDGAGYRGHPSEISFYVCPDNIENCARELLRDYPSIQPGEPWPQSDHTAFVIQQIPAMALTTSAFIEVGREIAHTPKDTPELVDTTLLIDIASYLRDYILKCENNKG